MRGIALCHEFQPPIRSQRKKTPGVSCKATTQRAIVILPGLGNNQSDYTKLSSLLTSKDPSLVVTTANVSRLDWARNARGLLDTNYWRGTLTPRPTVDWYLDRVAAAVAEVQAATPTTTPITLLAHSAGGWLGRLVMLDYGTSSPGIVQFVSLGSPHQPPPPQAGIIDQTRGILTWIADHSPGAYHADVEYITIAGKYIQGAPLFRTTASWQRRVVGAGYAQVCGEAEAWGDGVVPVPAAHLEGSTLQLTLEGVYHSPLGAEEGTPTDGTEVGAALREEKEEGESSSDGGSDNTSGDSDDYDVSLKSVEEAAAQAWAGRRYWYGSEVVLDQWVGVLRREYASVLRGNSVDQESSVAVGLQ